MLTSRLSSPLTRPLSKQLDVPLYGDASLVDLSFMGSLPSICTFSRASNAWRFNSSGVLETVAANVPRFDYDPETLALRGLLGEEARTNLVKSSNATNVGVYGSPTITANAGASPDGSSNAVQVATSVSSSGVYLSTTNAPLSPSTQYTLSLFIKYISGTQTLLIGVPNSFTGNTGDKSFTLNLLTKVVSSVDPSISNIKVVQQANGWLRVSYTSTTAATATGGGQLMYTAGGTGVFQYYGLQTEQGSFATSPILTSGTALTRAADSLYVGSIPWFNPTQGAMAATVLKTIQTNVSGAISEFNDTGSQNRWFMESTGAGGNGQLYAAGVQVSSGSMNATLGQINNYGTSFKQGQMLLAVNGVITHTGAPASLPTGLNRLTLGCRGNPTSSGQFNGHLRRFRYWNRALSNAELQRVTI